MTKLMVKAQLESCTLYRNLILDTVQCQFRTSVLKTICDNKERNRAINRATTSCFNQNTFKQQIVNPDLSVFQFKKLFLAAVQPQEEEILQDAGSGLYLIQCKSIKQIFRIIGCIFSLCAHTLYFFYRYKADLWLKSKCKEKVIVISFCQII